MYVICTQVGLLSLLQALLTTHWVPTMVVLTLLTAALFGWLYDSRVVEHVNREWPDHGYTSFLVVGGVLVLLVLSAPVIGLMNAVYMFCLFAAAGIFMVWGDMRRNNARRVEDREALKSDLEGLLAGLERRGDTDDAS